MAKVSEIKVEDSDLLQKGYSTKDLLGQSFTVGDFIVEEGDGGEYLKCTISGQGLEEGKPFNTGAQNIVARLKAAKKQGLLPIDVTVVKIGGNAYDIN